MLRKCSIFGQIHLTDRQAFQVLGNYFENYILNRTHYAGDTIGETRTLSDRLTLGDIDSHQGIVYGPRLKLVDKNTVLNMSCTIF